MELLAINVERCVKARLSAKMGSLTRSTDGGSRFCLEMRLVMVMEGAQS